MMTIDPRILALKPEVAAWRQDIHANPELLYDVHRTAALVAQKLRDFGCDEVVEGIGRTGVVGVIHGRNGAGGRAVGFRADMDALPIEEETNLPYRSKTAGKMHACGHDGHTAMLLGAAKHLAATREFEGTVVAIFQPAEEGGAGAKAMLDDGLMERWPVAEVYAMHNMPGLPSGHFRTRSGPIAAASDQFTIDIEGKGAHAAKPDQGNDPIIVGTQIVSALQTIASRNVAPVKSIVVSVTQFHAGFTHNVIPPRAMLAGTVRTLEEPIRELAERRLQEIVDGMAKTFGVEIRLTYQRGYPSVINHAHETEVAAAIAATIAGEANVDPDAPPSLGGEDFAYMLQVRPGAFVYIGNGDSAGLHHPAYNFNDDTLPAGMQYWTELAKARTAPEAR